MSLQLLAKGVDPPWQFVLEPVSLEGAPLGGPEGPQGTSTAAVPPPAAAGGAAAAARSVAVGALDFAAPEGFIFLPPWVMEALGLQYVSLKGATKGPPLKGPLRTVKRAPWQLSLSRSPWGPPERKERHTERESQKETDTREGHLQSLHMLLLLLCCCCCCCCCRKDAVVFCRSVSLPVGGTVHLRPTDPNFLEAAHAAGGLQVTQIDKHLFFTGPCSSWGAPIGTLINSPAKGPPTRTLQVPPQKKQGPLSVLGLS